MSDKPVCPDAGNGDGLGCPDCKRFEVRSHPSDCPEHGEHMELMCCWCGATFFSFYEIDHEHNDHEPSPPQETLQ